MDPEPYLRQDERIVSSFGPYHATSSRILLCLDGDSGPVLHEIPYSRLERIEEVRLASHRLMILGATAAIGGFVSSFSLGLFSPIMAGIAGVAMIIYGGIGKPGYYQIRARGMADAELPLWQLRHRGAGSFIASVRVIVGDSLGV